MSLSVNVSRARNFIEREWHYTPRTLEVEDMTNAVGQYSSATTSSSISMDEIRIASLHNLMIDGKIPNVDARVATGDVLESCSGVFEALVHDLQ